MSEISPLVNEAERLLCAYPRDDIHDLSHHRRVWRNAQTISKSIRENVDMGVLHVAVMWHDVMISKESLSLGLAGVLEETMAYLSKLMDRRGYGERFRESVLDAIRHHNFLTKWQLTLEGKILFDADKLDALNPVRYRKMAEAIRTKRLSKTQVFLYAKAAKVWLKTMRSRYHFAVSRALHDKRIEALLKDREIIQTAKEFGVDIVKLVR